MAKLTLNIEASLIEQMKEVAKRKKTSISKIAEGFFKEKVQEESKPFRMKSMEELADIMEDFTIKGEPVPDFDHKAAYGKHLEEKYGV